MQASTLRREFFTSLVGTVPMADLLADLPMPSHVPTPMERSVRGEMPLSAESHKVLSTAEPGLCNKITKALLSVDTSFLELKSHVSSEPYVPTQHAPPLIYSLFSKGLGGQPTLRLNKLDPTRYNSPMKSTGEIGAPLKAISDPNQSQSPADVHFGKQHDLRPDHSAVDTSRPVKKAGPARSKVASVASNGVLKPRKKPPAAPHDSMLVSIDRSQLPRPDSALRVTKKRSGEKLGRKGRQPQRERRASRERADEGAMVVRYERRKLAGAMGVKVKHIPPPLPPLSHGHGHSFTMMAAPFPPDPLITEQRKPLKKKKRRRHSHRGDPAKLAAIQHYTALVDSLLDTEDKISDDNLLSRSAISQLVAETAKLKQLAVLHEIPVDSLVRMIGIMDKHVLDSAELYMNIAPVADDGGGDAGAWREAARERVLRSMDAALAILHINTAPNMPKNVHQEESLEQLLTVTRFHLENNVYPEFDPVYRAGTKDGGSLPRQKRRHGGSHSASRDVQAVYRKLTEVVENLALLLETQLLTDTTVLQISSVGTFPFFVENVSSLQLSSLRLVRAIFSRYEKHRELILEDIFASLARLPTTKRNLRSFKLSNGSSVQMVTALILQLVQCIVALPEVPSPQPRSDTPPDGTAEGSKDPSPSADPDVQMINSYELALTTGKTFLSTFMKKCCGGKEEDDFRPLFDNFVQDLLTTLNLPEWPASEVLLTLLGVLLVHSFSNRSNEHSLRVTSLDHLGVIAARLRRDAADSVDQEHEELVTILAQVMQGGLEHKAPSPTTALHMDAFSENSKYLQKALIAYLNKRSETDPSCAYSRDFYLGQWLRDAQVELERAMKDGGGDMDTLTSERNGDAPAINSSAVALQQAELKKDILYSMISSKSQSELKHLEGILDGRSAAQVARYLASSRALSRSFDVYLQQLIRVLSEPEVRMRTRAMKALSSIIDADPSILSRPDMQRAVQCRFMDQSTLVREAAVDLLGRSVLSRPELTSQYYDMLSERILDTGVSVRKRVIKILKDICVLQPHFPRTSEICVKMMKRISDEEGIKQLVSSVFRELWFTVPPTGADQREALERRVQQITAVVGSCKEYEWFEQLLEQLLKTDDKTAVKAVLEVSQLMVDCLVESLLTLDETSALAQGSAASSSRLVTCITTLYLFCKTRPPLLLRHATTLHPYLSSKCSSQGDMMVLHYVAQILRQVVPLMDHPSESFLASLEEDLIKLVMKHGQMIVQSCIHCLGAVVNSVTHNYSLVRDCFQKFFLLLEKVKTLHSDNPHHTQLKPLRPSLLRSAFTVGLLCKHFDVDTFMPTSTKENLVSGRVFSQLVYFSHHQDEEVQLKAVTGLGFFCVRHPEMMLEQNMRELYSTWLASQASSKKKCQVLRNLQHHLKEVETTLKVADVHGSEKQEDKENLLEFGDQQSNVSSNIAQAFLSAVLESFLDTELQVRLGAVQVLLLIIRQGLVHPEQCVPYLITISTDPETSVRVKANQQLTDHSSRYGHFVQTTLMAGVKKSYVFHHLLFGDQARGYLDSGSSPTALLGHVYSLLRSNKQHRRALLRALLRYFEDYERNSLGLLLFLADNLAYFPYATLEEPLFVVHHVDMTISVSGSNILQAFREALGGSGAVPEEEEEDIGQLSQCGCDTSQLAECCRSSQGCFLLLLLKQHLKRMYGLTDAKCQQYSPTESNKAFDKAANRRSDVAFEPHTVLEELQRGLQAPPRAKEDYLKTYIEFKRLMNRLDPFEEGDESDGEDPVHRSHSTTPAPQPSHSTTSAPQPSFPVHTTSQPHTKVQSEIAVHRDEPPSGPLNPPRGRSRSRASSTSSVASVGSKRGKKSSGNGRTSPPKPVKKRRRFFSSDSDDEDPEYKM